MIYNIKIDYYHAPSAISREFDSDQGIVSLIPAPYFRGD